MAYLDIAGFKNLTVIPSSFVDDLEAVESGWLAAQLAYWSRWIDSRLSKRYAAPFPAHDDTPSTPPAVQAWLARIVTVRVMLKRGVDQNDEQFIAVADDDRAAREEIQEAANSDVGLFDLPLHSTTSASGITRGGPFGYSETSPYVHADEQIRVGRFEDSRGRGS